MAKAARAAQVWRTYRSVSQPGSPGVGDRLKALPRLIGAVMRGEYAGMSKGKLAMMGMGVLYIVSPLDVVPDFLVLLGVVDDFGVFLWLMSSLLGEGGRYVDWERERVARVTGVPS
ncbi:YkvA family protein [Streptosporangium sp. DT93]|uniref:YkvA family protein n=1 Tax=Streptosporangium sp. DT93 TaxID=3393428 RepID=UPI003CEDB824